MFPWFIIIIFWFDVTNCLEHFSLIRKESLSKNAFINDYWCITNSSYALSWICEYNETSIQASTFIPELSENKWIFHYGGEILDYWSQKNSINGKLNEIILDRRWEKFGVKQSIDTLKNNETLFFIPVVSKIIEANFTIPFSIRVENEAHILLCDGVDVTKSNCYWFILGGFGGSKTVFRKCNVGNIHTENNKLPDAPCKNNLVEKFHPKDLPNYLSNEMWVHFKLNKIKNYFTINQIKKYKSEEILSYDDNSGKAINVSHMIIHSKKPALWKIHDLQYLYTAQETKNILFGSEINVVENSVCISMFVWMCQSCQITLTLGKKENRYEILGETTYFYEKSGWIEIDFIIDNIKVRQAVLIVSTNNNDHANSFWAVSDITQCQKNKFRKIALTTVADVTIKCQLLSEEEGVISTYGHKNDAQPASHCPEDAISKYCVPCSWILSKSCGKLRVCEKQGSAAKCSCSAGYTSYGNYCIRCPGSTFGHGCRGRYGPKRDIPPSTIFQEAPNVLETGYNYITIKIYKFRVHFKHESDPPDTYTIQYKKSDKPSWTSYEKFTFKESKITTLVGLEAGSNYSIRCVITSTKGKFFLDDRIPASSALTKCDEITVKNLQIEPTNTTVEISLIKTTWKNCKFNLYNIYISKEGRLVDKNYTNVFFDELIPFTKYTVIVKKDFSKYKIPFRTNEGVPEKVKNLNAQSVSATTISLQWESPDWIYGDLQYYIVENKHLPYIACDQEVSDIPWKSSKNVTKTSVTISDLTPNSNYSFAVFAKNSKLNGLPETIWQATGRSDTIYEEEVLKIQKIEASTLEANIQFSSISCNKIKEPLYIKINVTCTNKWCNNRVSKEFSYPSKISVRIENLKAFSDYIAEARYYINNSFRSGIIKSKPFKTEPTAPGPVLNLVVYSKNETSISLRWEPPYPPTGILNIYSVTYHIPGRHPESQYFSVMPCPFWPQYHCVHLFHLKENSTYDIMVKALNIDPQTFGQSTRTKAITKKEPSEAPYDLVITWTLENDLKIQWKHPNRTNGDIKHFKIQVLPKITNSSSNMYANISVANQYRLTYNYKVSSNKLLPSTEYRIRIIPFNGQDGDNLVGEDTSPPSIPQFNEDPKFSFSNNTIKVDIIANNLKYQKNNYTLLVLASDKNTSSNLHPTLQKFEGKTKNVLSNFRVVYECSLKDAYNISYLTINNDSANNGCRSNNPPLTSKFFHDVKLLLVNTFKNRSSYKLYTFNTTNSTNVVAPSTSPMNMLNILILVLLLLQLVIISIVVAVFVNKQSLVTKYNFDKRSMCRANYTEIQNEETPLQATSTTKQNVYSKNGLEEEYVKQSMTTIELKVKLAHPKYKVPEDYFQKNQYSFANLFSNKIQLSNFITYLKECKMNGEFERQHALILSSSLRKVYENTEGSEYFDYIDMEYTNDKIPKAYIATEMPKPDKIDNFWNTIWEENVQYIVLLGNHQKEKFTKYWPKKNKQMLCRKMTVQFAFSETFPNYKSRTFVLIHEKEKRQVIQIHHSYCGLNPKKFVTLFRKLSNFDLNSNSPICVHSSNGLEETGLVLLCDMCLRTARNEETIDVLHNLKRMSDYNVDLVNNIEHYKLIHLIISEYFFGAVSEPDLHEYINF